MTIRLAVPIRSAKITAVKNAIDAATTAGKILFYKAAIPTAIGGAMSSDDLIATCELSKPCGTVSTEDVTIDGVTTTIVKLTLDVISDDLAADHSGNIVFGRFVDGDNNFVMDASAGVNGSNHPCQFLSLAAVAGGTVKINSAVFKEGNA